MDKQPVGQLPDLTQSNNDDEIMVITNSEYNQLKKEKISDFITDLTSTNENNALTKGTDGKMFVTDFGNASNITEGTLPVSVLPNIPKELLPEIETTDLPASGVTADTYAYPSSVTVNAQGMVTSISEGSPSGANADTDLSNLTETGESHFANPDLSNLTPAGEKHFLNKTQITNCILEAPNGVAEWSGVTPTGTLVNNQGVVSGFSEDNYLSINKTPPAETMEITSFELFGTSSASVVKAHSMIYGQLNGNYTTPQLGWSQSGNPGVSVSDDGSTWTVAQVTSADGFVAEANQTYNMLATWDSTSKTLTFKIKKDTDATYTFSNTTTVDSVNWTGLMAIGMDQISTGEYFRGTIDLSQSYIKINGKMWWQGNDLGFNQFRVKEGLKTLIPNGRNENGTLRNIENNVTQDLIYTFVDNATGSYWAAVGENATRLNKKSWEYNNDENYIIGTLENVNVGQKELVTRIGEMEVKNGNITSFVPYNPVSIATKDDINSEIFRNKLFKAFCPDYSAGISRTAGTSYTCTTDGWLHIQVYRGSQSVGYIELTINGKKIKIYSDDYSLDSIFYMLATGDKYSYTETGLTNSYEKGVIFYPVRGGV